MLFGLEALVVILPSSGAFFPLVFPLHSVLPGWSWRDTDMLSVVSSSLSQGLRESP